MSVPDGPAGAVSPHADAPPSAEPTGQEEQETPDGIKGLIARLDSWQRGHRVAAVAYGVIKKFGDDQANLLVVGLGWYGFTAIYPLLLVVVTIFGFVGVASLGHGIVDTLHQFPVIGTQFSTSPTSSKLHGSVIGLVIGVLGLLYGAQGVTQMAQKAMARVWNLPQGEQPSFVTRLGRSLGGLTVIGGSFVINAFVGSFATGDGRGTVVRVLVIAGMLVLNVMLYLASFRILTPSVVETRSMVPGAVLGAVVFTLLITLGTGLIEHQLKNDSATYGAFASVIGVVAFLLILAKLTVYAAELNPVLDRNLSPRSIVGPRTDADRRVAALRAEEVATKPST